MKKEEIVQPKCTKYKRIWAKRSKSPTEKVSFKFE